MKDLLDLLDKLEKHLDEISAPKRSHEAISFILNMYRNQINSGSYPPKNQPQPEPSQEEPVHKPNQSKSKE